MYELPAPPPLPSRGDVDEWCVECGVHRPPEPGGVCPSCMCWHCDERPAMNASSYCERCEPSEPDPDRAWKVSRGE